MAIIWEKINTTFQYCLAWYQCCMVFNLAPILCTAVNLVLRKHRRFFSRSYRTLSSINVLSSLFKIKIKWNRKKLLQFSRGWSAIQYWWMGLNLGYRNTIDKFNWKLRLRCHSCIVHIYCIVWRWSDEIRIRKWYSILHLIMFDR